MLGELRTQGWKATAIGAAALALALGVTAGVQTARLNSAEARADKLHDAIWAPLIGYEARLGMCQGNEIRLEATLGRQNHAVDALKRESDARIAAAESAVAAAQRQAAEARVRADRLASATITGATLCERVQDVDRLVLEILR